MTATAETPAIHTAPIRVEVTLAITHRVVVEIDGHSGQTMDELKDAALEEFHRGHDPVRGYVAGRRTDDKWRAQFDNRSNIDVSSERVELTALTTAPRR